MICIAFISFLGIVLVRRVPFADVDFEGPDWEQKIKIHEKKCDVFEGVLELCFE